MFDRMLLRDGIVVCVGLLVLARVLEFSPALLSAITAAIFILIALFASMKTTVLPRITSNIFESNFTANEFKEKFETDREFHQAVEYCYRLSPDDFLKFVRLVVEVRDQSGQTVLRELRNFLLRSKNQ